MKGFTFANIHSSEYELYVRADNRTIAPSLRRKTMIIPQKHGTIETDNNTYDVRNITMHLSLVRKTMEDLRQQARNIAEWLSRDGLLIFDDEPDKAYKAKVYQNIDIEEIAAYGKSKVTFTCQPFAYMVIGTAEDLTWDEANFPWTTDIPWGMVESYKFKATSNKDFNFNNPGTKEINFKSPQDSRSLIKINGLWTTLEIELNGSILQYTTAGSGNLVIDNVEMEAELNGINKLSALDGDIDEFLTIMPGNNLVKIRGTGLNIEVIIDFVPMWI